MRDELRNIANIEDYLSGKLSPEQVSIIENKINSDTDFAKDVNAQRELTNHFKIKAFQGAVQTHQIKYNRIILTKSILFVVAILSLIAFSIYYFFPSSEMVSSENSPSINEQVAIKKSEAKLDTTEEEKAMLSIYREVNTEAQALPSDQDKQSKVVRQEDQPSKIDSVDNTVNLLNMRDALYFLPSIDNDIVDMIINNSSPVEKATKNRAIWKIEDRFSSYFTEKEIPIKVTAKNQDIELEYSFTAVRGSSLIITLIDPNGKEIEVINMVEDYKKLQLDDILELEHVLGTWNIRIKTVGQGYFLMKINSNE